MTALGIQPFLEFVTLLSKSKGMKDSFSAGNSEFMALNIALVLCYWGLACLAVHRHALMVLSLFGTHW